MQCKTRAPTVGFVLMLILISIACAAFQPTATKAPEPTISLTATPTNTPRPSPTPRPTRTPGLAATQHAEELNAEVQAYYEKGQLTTTDGRFIEFSDFRDDWAQLGWYNKLLLT